MGTFIKTRKDIYPGMQFSFSMGRMKKVEYITGVRSVDEIMSRLKFKSYDRLLAYDIVWEVYCVDNTERHGFVYAKAIKNPVIEWAGANCCCFEHGRTMNGNTWAVDADDIINHAVFNGVVPDLESVNNDIEPWVPLHEARKQMALNGWETVFIPGEK